MTLKGYMLLFTLIIMLCIPLTLVKSLSGEETALLVIEDVEVTVKKAYQAIYEASLEDVDIIQMANELNNALELLQEAIISYQQGDIDSAISIASDCKGLCNGIIEEAKISSLTAADQVEANNVRKYIETRGTFLSIIISSIIFWIIFKAYYLKRALGMRPEVL